MPAQKRPFEIHQQPDTETDPSQSSSDHDHDDAEDNDKEKPEYVVVRLSEVRKEVQCPICLGVIRKTRTVMECLHRFCRECIDKSMRLGNNECPACRTHCASRRSLRDDPNFDALIAALYPDIDKYEEEELALCEEEKAHNKQVQDTISQTFRRQAEALSRKKTTAKVTARAFARRREDHDQDVNSKAGRNYRIAEGSDESNDVNREGSNDSSSADEDSDELKPKRCKRQVGASLISGRGANKNDPEVSRESSLCASTGLIGPSERLWSKGGLRSHTRHGSGNASSAKNSQNSRISKLVEHLSNLEEKDNEMDVHLMLISLDEQRTPSLQRPYLCCRPTLSVKTLHQYIALQTALQADELDLYLADDMNPKLNPSTSTNLWKDKLQVLEEEESVGGLKPNNFLHGHVVLAYQKKSK